jgi:hypothetical protein
LSGQNILEQALDGMVAIAHKDLVVYHVNRDSTAIPTREKTVKKPEKKALKQAKVPFCYSLMDSVYDSKGGGRTSSVSLSSNLPANFLSIL